MVAMNESDGAHWAFNYALNNMDKVNDTLVILTVSDKKVIEEPYSREVLLRFARRAERMDVKNVKLWLRMGHNNVGQTLCESVEDAKVDTLVLGHEEASKGIFGHPSVTKYCISNAHCNVVVARREIRLTGADTLLEVEMRDQLERKRRAAELGEVDAKEPVTETFEKHLTIGGKTYAVEVTF